MITLPAPTTQVLHSCYTVVAPSTVLQLNYSEVVALTSLLVLLPFSCCSAIAPAAQLLLCCWWVPVLPACLPSSSCSSWSVTAPAAHFLLYWFSCNWALTQWLLLLVSYCLDVAPAAYLLLSCFFACLITSLAAFFELCCCPCYWLTAELLLLKFSYCVINGSKWRAAPLANTIQVRRERYM